MLYAGGLVEYFDFEIMGLKRKLPFVKIGENLALASFVVLSDTELIQKKYEALHLVGKNPEGYVTH